MRLVATEADTELQIDGDNDGSFETVITLNGTTSGTISIGSEPHTNKVNYVIRIVTPSSAVPTSGSDILVGTPAADTIDGLAGDDEIFGLAGNDTFIGGTGSDTLYGSYGNDDLSGGADNDTLFGDSGADTLEGGGGYDGLYGGDGDDVLTDSGYDVNSAYGADAYMDGGAGNDILRATGGRSELHGGADNDTLIGGTAGSYGWDYLLGEDGNDTLLGNGDRDVLTGGPGADTFAFVLTTDSAVGNPDVITDWESSDKIDLAAIDANTSLDGNQDFTFLGLGAAGDWTVGQGQLKYYHHVGDTWVIGNVTADNQVDFADFQIRINGLHNLTAGQIQGIVSQNTYTIGDRGNFATITEALASGSVGPGDNLALLSGYRSEIATVGIENLTFAGDASNTGIVLLLNTGIMDITLTGTATDHGQWRLLQLERQFDHRQ